MEAGWHSMLIVAPSPAPTGGFRDRPWSPCEASLDGTILAPRITWGDIVCRQMSARAMSALGCGRILTEEEFLGMYGKRCLLSGSLIMLAFSAPSVGAMPPGHGGGHPPMPEQKFLLQCRLDGGPAPFNTETEIKLPSAAEAASLTQEVGLPEGLGTLRLKEYLPRAALTQQVEHADDPKAAPAMQITISGPKQSLDRWLVSGAPERNRLTSFIGTWRYMAVENKSQRDELLRQFKTELTRDPMIIVSQLKGDGATGQLAAKAGTSKQLKALACRVRVKKFFSHYALDDSKKEPVNVSEKRANPAALVEIEHDGRREERWVFSRFPSFGTGQADALPFRVVLDCAAESKGTTPDFVLVTVDRKTHEVWWRHLGKQSFKKLSEGEKAPVPGSQYTFHIKAFEPTARLVETYVASKGRDAGPAFQVVFRPPGKSPMIVWLQLGKQRAVPTAKGNMFVAFGLRPAGPSGGH